MSQLPEPIPLAEAQQRLLDLAKDIASPLRTEHLPIEQAVGRFLARDCRANRTQPPADLSAMDGYALRVADAPGPWNVVGESAAGHPFDGQVGVGEAIRISTGAFLPEGADSVLIQENTDRDGDRLVLTGDSPIEGKNIRRKGFDFASGDVVLKQGTRIDAAQIALGFAAGLGELPVKTRPSLAILDSGDELSADPASCGERQIPASNGVMLQSMCAPYCHDIRRLGPVADDRKALASALAQADGVDVLVTSGGASVGDHDLIRPSLEDWGAEIGFWRVKMKPGKPIMVARNGHQIILGLPGNPVSAYVGSFLFLIPVLKQLCGARDCLPPLVRTVLHGELPSTGPRLELVRGRWDGQTVHANTGQDSSGLRSLEQSNALIRREPHSESLPDGSPVEVHLL